MTTGESTLYITIEKQKYDCSITYLQFMNCLLSQHSGVWVLGWMGMEDMFQPNTTGLVCDLFK